MKLEGKHVAMLVEDGFEDLEFWVPYMRLREEGAKVTIVGSRMERFKGKHCLTACPEAAAQDVIAELFYAASHPF
jgi:protease I